MSDDLDFEIDDDMLNSVTENLNIDDDDGDENDPEPEPEPEPQREPDQEQEYLTADTKPIILDMGTFSTKVGLAGSVKPIEERTMMVVSTTDEGKDEPKSVRNIYGQDALEKIIKSYQADSKRRDAVNNVVHDTISLNAGNLEPYLKEAIFHEDRLYEKLDLHGKFKPSAHPVLLTDQVQSAHSHRNGVTELLFESFGTPAVYWEQSGILALYAMGIEDGLIVDMGHSQTSITPVVQGYCLEHATKKVHVGGRHLDLYFNHLLRKAGITLHTNYWLETLRKMKEEMCHCQPDKAFEKLGDDGEMQCKEYKMPDGSVMKIGNALKRAPELFFGPHLLGLHCSGVQHQILDCINDCELAVRRTLMSNIRLIGGSTMMTGLGRRLVNELALSDYNRYEYDKMMQSDAPETDPLDVRHSVYNVNASSRQLSTTMKKPKKIDKKTQVRLFAPESRKYSAWIGGSVLCAMPDFAKTWITKKDWEEHGNSVLYRGVNWR